MPLSTFPREHRLDKVPGTEARQVLRLICLPHAGGNASAFAHWKPLLGPHIEVRPIQYPGRGARFCELPHRSMAALVEEICTELIELDDCPFALFGHSMGALVAFETAKYLRNSGRGSPAAIFLSGCDAPQVFKCHSGTSEMTDKEFRAKLAEYGGMPRELMENDELMNLLLPIIRADFDLLARYEYRDATPLDIPLVTLRGHQDRQVSVEAVGEWRRHTTGAFSSHDFEGDHFFIHPQTSRVLGCIREVLGAVRNA